MLSPLVRLILVLACIPLGAYLTASGNPAAWVFFGCAALLVYGHFRYGTVWRAFRAMKRGDVDEAERWINRTRPHALLSSQSLAYRELTLAYITESRDQLDDAERHLRRALTHRLRTDNDRALTEAGLADLLLRRGEFGEAAEYLDRASQRGYRPELQDELTRVRELIVRGDGNSTERLGH